MSGRDWKSPRPSPSNSARSRKRSERTLIFRRSAVGDGLRYAVRGYMQGRLDLGGKKYATLLIDGNANGCFDTVGQDRVWIDLNHDGRLRSVDRAIPLGQADHPRRRRLRGPLRCHRLGRGGQPAERRPGKTAASAGQRSSSQPAKISAELVSDLGELVSIDKLDEATPVPFGEYRLSSLKLDVPDATGQTWTYNFYQARPKTYAVPTNQETTISATAGNST